MDLTSEPGWGHRPDCAKHGTGGANATCTCGLEQLTTMQLDPVDEPDPLRRAERAWAKVQASIAHPRRAVRVEEVGSGYQRVHYGDGTWDDFGPDGLPLQGD